LRSDLSIWIMTATFVTSAPHLEGCPDWDLAEFALIGRSNSGKSSLLNLLAGNSKLARVSATPGATQMINFYQTDEGWSLVDLPGYGFSKTSQAVRDGFQAAVSGYLVGRTNLRCVLVLIDSRHGPQAIDLEFCEWLAAAGRRFALVFTKIDKSKPAQVRSNVDAFLAALAKVCDGTPRTFLTSSNVPLKLSGRNPILDFVRLTLAAGE
jgi:GTP-binding protein